MGKAQTPADALRDRLASEREALLPALDIDLEKLRGDVRAAAATVREYRESPTRPHYPNASDQRALALGAAMHRAEDALRRAEQAATNARRRIAEIDAVLGAAALAENIRTEQAARTSEHAALLERRAALTGALAGMRADADAIGARQARELDAAAERDVAARIAGKPAPAAALVPDATAAELARLRAAIVRAEGELASIGDRIKAQRAEAREAEGPYYRARYRAALLELDAALLPLEPLRVAAEAARLLAYAQPEPLAPLDALAVRRALEAMRGELPQLPADPPKAEAPGTAADESKAGAIAAA